MKIRCLIVDDEPIAQQILEKYIAQIEVLELAGKCNNAFEALNVLHRENIDLVFLDIKMPLLSGLEMLKTLQNSPKIILTTAFSEFGVESYEYNVADYLLKPISFERFLKAVNKVALPHKTEITKVTRTENKETVSDVIFFRADRKIHKLFFEEIIFIEGNGNYVKVYTESGKPLSVLDKLSDLERKLPEKQFIRVHKSYIVNSLHIDQIDGNLLKLKGHNVQVSASYKPNIEAFFNNK